MRTFRIRRDSWTVLAGILNANEPFTTAGSMHGETNATPFQGHMPWSEYQLVKDAAGRNGGVLDYAVWSYATIIGYRVGTDWVVPDCTYSKTTTIQQTKLRVALNV